VGVTGFDISTWYGVMAPANTPPDIIKKLNSEIVKILGSGDMREKLKVQGAEPAPTSPEEFAAFIRAEWTRYAKIVKDSGARVD
jgi:tripartite-type tricarboxylate transporter receptor subunit TctC